MTYNIESSEIRLDKLIFQYKEALRLRMLISRILDIDYNDKSSHMATLPDEFNIDTSTGETLTAIGNLIGWPRTHECGWISPILRYDPPDGKIPLQERPGYFGFCNQETGENYRITGFCSEWYCDDNTVDDPPLADYSQVDGCTTSVVGTGDISNPIKYSYTFTDDDEYRHWLRTKVVANRSRGYMRDTIEVAELVYGDPVTVIESASGELVLQLTRIMTDKEIQMVELYRKIIPSVRGVGLKLSYSVASSGNPFAFCSNSAGFCSGEFNTTIKL